MAAECTGPADEPYTLRLIGNGFEEHEGKTLFVATHLDLAFSPGETCRARARVQIEGGAFDVSLVNFTDGNIYPIAFAYIDMDADGECESTDLTWSTLPAWAFLTLTLAPSDFARPAVEPACEGLAPPQ